MSVDDDPGFLDALGALLGRDGRFDLVGRVTDGAQGVRHAVLLRPDVVTMDFDMPVMDGIEATRRIIEALPETRVVLVSGSQYQDHVASAREAGAAGYLAKSRVADQLVDTLVEVAAGAEFVLRV